LRAKVTITFKIIVFVVNQLIRFVIRISWWSN